MGRDTRDGLVVGLIAYVAVAVFYSAFDFLAARGTLYTVNLLGRTVFRGLRDPTVLQYPVQLDSQAIFLYNGMHLVLSLLIGLVVVRMVGYGERNPSRAGSIAFLIVAGFVSTILAVGTMSQPIRPVLPWWSIAVANSAAVLLAGRYLIKRRPGLLGRMIPFLGATRTVNR